MTNVQGAGGPQDRAPRTVAAANGVAADERFGAVAPPLYLSSSFAFAGYDAMRDYDYSRTANPSRDLLADTLARLEGGAGAIITASGMAAADLVLSRLGRDDRVIASHDCYGGTCRLLAARRDRGQFDLAFVDQTDETAMAAALEAAAALVFIETPSNPTMAHAGIGDSLLRLSVGLEAEADLLVDLARGLDAIGTAEAKVA
ncbi:PLP-dependent transferase [Bosea sp. (in: a-proteobacteria)]|uniref:PLP-dependent transferase n=1 Tax=Bosea sp. (in: a-proteobacteria) TaxID=1871050 RepID=UPI002606D669|nr:PLP-dependent transferase [Bosea sp. (in: a-proteobacteria)]MCO5090584.1 PLP-dependent transferase [Bosea sp. (in: a-proteobacteria)]